MKRQTQYLEREIKDQLTNDQIICEMLSQTNLLINQSIEVKMRMSCLEISLVI